MDTFFLLVTWLGSGYVLLPVAACISLLLIWAGKWNQATLLSFSLVITIVSVHVLKLVFRRPRPAVTELLLPMPLDWSFPSGHTAQATAFFLALSLVALRTLPPIWAGVVAAISLPTVVAVGYSRVYLHVHYLSDVVAGMVLAVLVVSALRAGIPLLPWFQGK